ncbi:hypothetical protein LL037_10430 [Clostridium estertheticum]|nr:phenylpyruvate tautomerase MIF-related protein [Clostridium estertheticum]MBU3199226.1 hypothetical protein [Clostridium estertheticum]WAG67523.1 hypothetical protein LL037_10430 [Clostridium estertheticum]
MPFIISKVNVPISKEQEIQLKARLGKAIELVPGKSEEYLLTGFEENYHLYLRGDDSQPIAYIKASIFGNEGHYGYDKLTMEITKIFGEILGIAPHHVYVKYDDIQGWGVNGMYFDRNQYME